MTRRQTDPHQWLIVNAPLGPEDWTAIRGLSRGSGILLLVRLGAADLRRLRQLSRLRDLRIVRERAVERVHNAGELRRALGRRTPLVLLSPIYPTRTHPDWNALPVMRAATLARLGGRRLVALGGMDARRFARVRELGFQGWAGISAFRT